MMTRREFVSGSVVMLAAHQVLAQQQPTGATAQPTGAGEGIGTGSAAPGTIRATAKAAGLLAGCAVAVGRLASDPAYVALIKAQAGIVVAESEMKFGPMRPTPTTFDFTKADALLAFAEANGMKLRGHNFVWHRQLAGWFESYVTQSNAAQVLVEHIERVGGRYAGKIHSWDVVNEAVHVPAGLPGGFRDSPWQKVLGGDGAIPAYLELAFTTARRVDPKALLVYNDYGIEAEDGDSAAKRKAVMSLLRAMQERGIPVDALGVQSHISAGGRAVYGKGLVEMIAAVRQMGLKVLLTEMDVNDRGLAPPIAARDAAVAEVYGSYLKMALADPAVIAILTWGITDKYTWLNGEDSRQDKLPERPLPFDSAMQPKPAAVAVIDALKNRSV